MTNNEYENPHWLNNWLRIKAKQEEKEFNEITKEEVKKNIKTLAFIQLGLKGKVVIEDYPDLKQLNLGNNELEEIVIRNCPDLKLVQVAHNNLTKLVIENCPSIKEIYTHNNQLTKWDFSVEELKSKNLRTISYSNNPLSAEEKARLDGLGLEDTQKKSRVDGDAQTWLDAKYPLEDRDKVEKLDLSSLGLQGDLSLESFTNLKSLDISDNEIEDLEVGDCKQLEYLDCSNNKIYSLILDKNKELQEVNASHNEIMLTDFNGLVSLQTLILTANSIDDLDLSSLSNLLHLNVGLNSLKELDLTSNVKLKHLLCYKNKIENLKVNHLSDLETFLAYKCKLKRLDCSGLSKLSELNCANSPFIDYLNVDGCQSLENLDCAENELEELSICNLPKLEVISCKENFLKKITISKCNKLRFIDFDAQHVDRDRRFSENKMEDIWDIVTELNIDDSSMANLKELFYPKSARNVPHLAYMPNLETVGIGQKKMVKDNLGEKAYTYHVEEIDVLAQRNTSRVIKILANPNDYSLEDILKLGKKELKGVSEELKEKLFELAQQKNEEIRLQKEREFMDELRRKFNIDEEAKSNPKKREGVSPLEKDSDSPSEEETPLPTPQESPTPKDNNKDKNVYEFNEEEQKAFSLSDLEQLEQFFVQHDIKNITLDGNNKLVVEYHNNNNNNKAELQVFNYLKSNNKTSLSHSELKQIIAEKKQEQLPSTNPTNYLPYILGGTIIVLMIGVFAYLLGKKKKKDIRW